MTTSAFWVLVNYLCSQHEGSVISGKRSVAHNVRVGGDPLSRHLDGRAADGRCETFGGREALFDEAYELGLRGYKKGRLFWHLQADAPRGAT